MTGSGCGGRLEFQVMGNSGVGTGGGRGNGSLAGTGTAGGHVFTRKTV
jgi:hypothetical protein